MTLVAEISTLCPHLQSSHRVGNSHNAYTHGITHQQKYLKWAEVNHFESMLPNDHKMQKDTTQSVQQQTQLDAHLQPMKDEKGPPYGNEYFHAAAVQWLVNTDQVILSTDTM